MWVLFSVLSVFSASSVSSASSVPTLFRTLGIRDGLRSNSVTSLLADSRGYLWIGTSQGLNRYDGHEVKTRFPESNDPRLREVFNNPVTSMEEDAEGRIWIECESGACYVYDTRMARFFTETSAKDYDRTRQRNWSLRTEEAQESGSAGRSDLAAELLRDIGITCDGKYKVKVGTKGTLWVLTRDSICRYDCIARELKTWKISLSPITQHLSPNAIVEVSDGLYISSDHAVWHFISSTGELQRQTLPDVMQRSIGEHSLMADADGTLWVYSTREEHVCRFIVGGRCVREMISLPQTTGASQNNAIRDMMDDGRGNIWIATDHKGLFVYHKKDGNITAIRNQREKLLSLASDNATCLAADRDGTIWVGHMKAGLSYTSSANSIMQPHALQCGDILTMEYDTQGRLWMGTDGNGVYIQQTDGSIVKTALPNITVMDLLSDGHGGVWAGTYNQGLYHLADAHRWEHFSVDNGSFPIAEAWTLAADDEGNIWASSPISKTVIFTPSAVGGQGKAYTILTTDDGGNIHGNSLLYDGAGTMYIASVYGLWSFDLTGRVAKELGGAKSGKRKVAFGNRKGTQQWLSQMITDVAIDRRQGLMVLTHYEGVTVFDMKQDTLYYLRCPSGDVIKGMARDHDGTYWLCTTSGSVASILPVKNSSLFTIHYSLFSPSVGIPQFYFNGDAMTCSPQGDILMGGTEGYMSINPRLLMSAKHEDRNLIISEIAVGDSLLNEQTSVVSLSHDAAHLTVKFFPGCLEGIQRMHYAYRLVGQMSEWATTDHNYVSFHALPPGDYTLQLCICQEDGTMSTPRSLRISVSPPFYRSVPMYIVYALMLIAIAFLLLHRMRKRQQERTEQQRQLMERQKTEQITEMKLQFFTNISHDLRTPLTLIISPLEQIVKKMKEGKIPDNLSVQLKNIHKNAQQLLGEVNALLDFRRLDAGGETLNLQRGDIVDHLNSILISFGDYAEERDIRLSFDHDTDSFIMDYDREKMNKVVYNLFSNALKFTPAGGSVTLSFHHDHDSVTIAVADTGKGIPDSDKPNIFRRFYQSASNDSSQTGSGIGLHIVNEYVRLHNGTISVSDNDPVGTVFTIKLKPISIPIPEQSSPTRSLSQGEESLYSSGAESNQTPLPLGKATGGYTLLIVDDNQDMLSFIRSCMKETYQVHTATDGAAALDILQREQIDLIVSDVMMPGIDGFELCRRVKSDINLSHIPIILLTARDTDVSRIEGLQLGADDYLTKPFNIEVLRLRVRKFIEWEQNNHRQFRQKMNIEPSEITITPLDEQFIKKAIALVEQNISDSDFSVETLASDLAMSRTTLYKKFMAITGLGPAEFIRTIRIKRGKALLETSQKQISEIAYAVGFTTVKSFTMNFKSEYGMTPSEFLAKRKGI